MFGRVSGIILLAGGLVLIALAGHFDSPPNAAQQQIVVATERVTRAELARSVVLVISQTKNRAWGLRLNDPAPGGEYFYGGAVERESSVHALHSLDVAFPETKVMKSNNLGLLQGKAAVEKLRAARQKPSWHRVFRGYSGWGKRVLNVDLDSGLWHLIAYDEKFVKETEPSLMWEKAMKMPRIAAKD